MTIRCALFEPDIPQNTGSIIRTATCLGVSVDIIEPMGFVWDERRVRRAGMDYIDHADVVRHLSWDHFCDTRANRGRVVLFTTEGAERLDSAEFMPGDCLLFGRESSGVPEKVHDRADARIVIPMAPNVRSMNVAVAAGIAMAEAIRQLDAWPGSR